MIAGLNAKQMRSRLDHNNWSARLLARVVCTTYWGVHEIGFRELEGLDWADWVLAISIKGYRRNVEWCDKEFCALTYWCCVRHNLRFRKEAVNNTFFLCITMRCSRQFIQSVICSDDHD
jgi:hypothetical protein